MAMSATTKLAAQIASAARTIAHQGRSQDIVQMIEWIACGILAMCQADGGNAPSVNIPWNIPNPITDGQTVNLPGM